MKTLGALWIHGCVIAFLGGVSVDGNTIPYSGREALLSYSPARGEFPVASLFGRGFFSYIDESGNSRIVSLEPNPLQGIRIDSEGRPLIEIGRKIDLESVDNQKPCEKEPGKLQKLKPIKEFDERPFQDSLTDKDVKLPAWDSSKEDLVDLQPLTVAATNEIGGQTKQLFVFPTDLPGVLSQMKPHEPGTRPDPVTGRPPNPQRPTFTPNTTTPPSLPTQGQYVQANPEVGLAYLPPKPVPTPVSPKPVPGPVSPKPAPGPVFLNPKNPFLPLNTISIQSTTPGLNSKPPSTTSQPSQQSPSTQSPVIVFPTTPEAFLSPTAAAPTSALPSFAPGNPFLPATTVFTNSSPPTPSPPPKNPFLSPDKPKEQRPPAVKPTPQFNADKMNPFLPTSPVLSTPNSLGLPQQVKDTPEVEQAKHEHFLAHQMALAQLHLAQQQDNLKRDDDSPSPKLPCDTSGHPEPTTIAPEPTEDSSPTTDAVPLLV